MANRKIPEINAGSMADIAFLLLVFFLVTTTIQTDSGLQVVLPQWVDEPPPPMEKNKRNVLLVVINGANQLSVNDQVNFDVDNLKQLAIDFITNNGVNPDWSVAPRSAVISLQNDNATDYSTYLEVYNELQAAYNKIWNSEAQKRFGRAYEALEKEEKLAIREDYPKFISEAEPNNFGEE